MHWGHAKSKDLVTWEHLPVALAPDQDYDRNGCFSGSAIVKDDRLWLMYTGHIEEKTGVRQVQNMAFSDDGIHFEKISQNPVATGSDLPDELIAADFRDPKLFEKDGRYYSVVAAKHKNNVGCIVLLGSDNLVEWQFESIFLKGVEHQGFMWECPDYFELDGKDCLIMSPMRYQREGDSYHNINSSLLFTGKVDWGEKCFIPESVQEIDHGQDFYAPQTLLDDQNRRILIAWMQTWGRTLPTHDQEHKWACAMTLPRILRLEDGKLRQFPVKKGQYQIQIDKDCHYHLGNDIDYLEFGYDSNAQQVYIDRSHLIQKILGEEEQDTSRRYVDIEAKELEVVLDKNSIEIFVNQGEASLTATYYLTVPAELSRID
ncbi:sucrose-6-phosphate hydrolase [Streptococcus pneumoniae]|nr:sucrose-6-phosphate hydrolase [Streptococcus pneumoniae]